MKIYIPVGTTASGKTTKCREWVANNEPAVHIEVDDLRTIFFKKYTFDTELEESIWFLTIDCVTRWLLEGFNVAVDDAVFFLNLKDRQIFQSILHEDIIWDYLPIPTDDEVRERRVGTERGISLDKWVEIKQQHERILNGR